MKTIFWNVDTQYDFMRDDDSFKGALPVPGAREIESKLEKLTKYARARDVQIVNTADWHTEKSRELSDKPDFKTTFPQHCMANTPGADYVPATAPIDPLVVDWNMDVMCLYAFPGADKMYFERVAASKEIVIRKDDFDVFKGAPYADRIVKSIRPDRAVVYGVATNVCVDYAVRGLLERGVEVYVATDAIKELHGIPLEPVLAAWKEKGAKLVTVDDIVGGD